MSDGIINQFINKLKKDKKLEAYIFYEESPIKVVLPVLDIDFGRKQIEFEINPKIEAMINQEKEIYIKFNNEVLLLRPLFWNKETLVTTFPFLAIEPKIKREHVRVKCSQKNPILLEIDDDINVCVPLRDISEKGFSFKLPKTVYLELNEAYSGKLNINGKSLPIVFKVLYKIERPDNTYRYGAKILNATAKVEDEVAKYIFERQREIAKILNTFAD
jgi:hypothetical protein